MTKWSFGGMTKGGADPKNSEKNVRCKPVKKETPE
jgi:hypothetical protein